MKKLIVLGLFSSLLLFGCGGGGGGNPVTNNTPGDNTGNTGGSPTEETLASLGNVSISFPPVVQSQKGLLDTDGLVRNGARIVVRKLEYIAHYVPVTEESCETITDYWDDGTPYTYEQCTHTQVQCVASSYAEQNCSIDTFAPDDTCDACDPDTETCITEVTNCVPGCTGDTCIPEVEFSHTTYTQTYKNVSDTLLDENGAGTASIGVPAGDGYSIEVLTYIAGELTDPATGVEYAFTPYPALAAGNLPTADENAAFKAAFASGGTAEFHLMQDYGYNNSFDIVSGQVYTETGGDITLEWPAIAKLSFPVSPILAGVKYDVSVDKSAAVSAGWYLRRALEGTSDLKTDLGLSGADLTTYWFLRDDVEIYSTSSKNTITLPANDTAEAVGPATEGPNADNWTFWHHAQFFMDSHLLNAGESYTNWTYGTADGGELAPMGQVVINANL